MAADSIAFHKESPGQRLIHHGHGRRIQRIGLGEDPAGAQRNAHCHEIVETYGLRMRDLRRRTIGIPGLPVDRERITTACIQSHSGYGQPAHGASVDYAWQPGESLPHLGEEVDSGARLCVTRTGDLHLHGQQMIGTEAGIDLPQPVEALQQQAGADQQHQRERDLAGHQHAGSAPPGTRSAQYPVHARHCQRGRRSKQQAHDT
jgi:hypothetical protein